MWQRVVREGKRIMHKLSKTKRQDKGTSLVVQWLRICPVKQGMWVPSRVRELRSHILWGFQAHVPQRYHVPQ